MISLYRQPENIHSSGNDNWYVFQSDMANAQSFFLELSIKSDGDLLNKLLCPVDPEGDIPFNVRSIIYDWTNWSITPFITDIDESVTYKKYNIDVKEKFSGLYFAFTASGLGNLCSTFSVLNNTSIKEIETDPIIESVGFSNNSTSDTIYIRSYTTDGDGFIDNLGISSSPTSSVAVSFNLSADGFGWIELADYPYVGYGGSYSTDEKFALLSSIDYLEYNSLENYENRLAGVTGSAFLTNAPQSVYIKDTEPHTLSLVYSGSASQAELNISTATGSFIHSTYSLTGFDRLDIPSGPFNLGISAKTYSLWMTYDSIAPSILYKFKVGCYGTNDTDNIRLAWVNDFGGIDYWTFRFVRRHTRSASAETYLRGSRWEDTKSTFGNTKYKIESSNSYEVVSDLITKETSEWLASILRSKWVWWIKGDFISYNKVDEPDLIPIIIDTSSVDISTYLNDLEITFNFTLSRKDII